MDKFIQNEMTMLKVIFGCSFLYFAKTYSPFGRYPTFHTLTSRFIHLFYFYLLTGEHSSRHIKKCGEKLQRERECAGK